ncbi:twin-arginine translocase subunit TatC, partial [Streptomyces sp. NPDC002573]
EASELDLTPEEIGAVEPVPAARALPESDGPDHDRVNGYDDVT